VLKRGPFVHNRSISSNVFRSGHLTSLRDAAPVFRIWGRTTSTTQSWNFSASGRLLGVTSSYRSSSGMMNTPRDGKPIRAAPLAPSSRFHAESACRLRPSEMPKKKQQGQSRNQLCAKSLEGYNLAYQNSVNFQSSSTSGGRITLYG
jgi:hypothetical protein